MYTSSMFYLLFQMPFSSGLVLARTGGGSAASCLKYFTLMLVNHPVILAHTPLNFSVQI